MTVEFAEEERLVKKTKRGQLQDPKVQAFVEALPKGLHLFRRKSR